MQHTINGLQVSYSFGKAILYSQLALSFLETDKASFQLGGRWYSPFGVKNLMLQGEYNNVPNGIYAARNNRMNYAQYNLPIAHVKGQGFEEVVFRINYSYKRAYIDWKSIHYSLHNYQNTSLVVAPIDYSKFHASIYHQQIEIGYRFNSLMNLKAFIRSVYRASNELNHRQTSVVVLGVSTDLIHHYNDF